MHEAVLDEELAGLLRSASQGAKEAFDELVECLHAQLRSLAQHALRSSDTLTTTGLLGETYLRLEKSCTFNQTTLPYFLGAAKTAMRRILVEHRLARERQKRGGDWSQLPMDLDRIASAQEVSLGVDVLDLFDALDELESLHPDWHAAVSCGYLLGQSSAEAAKHFSSETTFRKFRALGIHWLRRRLTSSCL